MPQDPRQTQFLNVVTRDEATARFQQHLKLEPLGGQTVPLGAALGRILAEDIRSMVDVPGFDRSNVDGFARAGDRHARRDGGIGARDRSQRRSAVAGDRSAATGHRGTRDDDRDRRACAARRRRRRDGRAHEVGSDGRHLDVMRAAVPPARTSAMQAPISRRAKPCCARGRSSRHARSACSPRSGLPRCRL